jgi:hypothetical protein
MALASLRYACPDPLREALARKIIELAKTGERDLAPIIRESRRLAM